MKLLPRSDIKQHMVTLPSQNRSFLPMKSTQEPVKLKNSTLYDNPESRKTKLIKAAEGFEAIFIRQLMGIMRKTVPNGGMFGEGTIGDIYGDMMDNALAEVLSKRSVLGLSDMLYRQLARHSDSSSQTELQDAKKLSQEKL